VIEFKYLFFSFNEIILVSTKEFNISIAMKPHLAKPAKGKVPNF